MEKPAGHAFISYVHEDAQDVDRLQRDLEAAGVAVWRDTANLWPGEDWRRKIRHAITENALVFVACFSSHSTARAASYQNEELALAIEQLRTRKPDVPWLIPVRFDDCSVPDLDIGAGRTLGSIQRADLFGEDRETGINRLLQTVLRLLGQHPPEPVERGKGARSVKSAGTSLRPDQVEDQPAVAADRPGQNPTPAHRAPSALDAVAPLTPVTDRWLPTSDGHQVPILLHLRNNSMSHPGYTSRSADEKPAPSIRFGIVVPCGRLGAAPTTSGIRAGFLKFLHSPAVSEILDAVTAVDPAARWSGWDGHGRSNFGAVLGDATEPPPAAWARLLIPTADTRPYDYDPLAAVFILHIDPRSPDGSPAAPARLTSWHDRFVRGLAMPGALAIFLSRELGLAKSTDPRVQAAVYLETPHSMTELVDTTDLKSLPGSPPSSWFMGWAISNADGEPSSALAREWLTQMCDSTLHVDGYEPHLATTANSPSATGAQAQLHVESTIHHDPSIVTPEIAVRRLKTTLHNPVLRVELSDLVNQEIQRLAARIADTARHPLSGMPFTEQLAAYEVDSEVAAPLLATGVFYGDETHASMWIRSLRRLMSVRRPFTVSSYNSAAEAMRHYPALLCLWAMGTSAILADREDFLAHLLLEPTWKPIFGDLTPQPAVHCLNPNRIVAADPAAPDGRRWLYPPSHHIRAASRNALGQLEPDDDTYQETCDRLEYLASLIAMDLDASNGFPWAGEFITRQHHQIQDSKLGQLLEGGAFGRDPKRAQAAREALTNWLLEHPKF